MDPNEGSANPQQDLAARVWDFLDSKEDQELPDSLQRQDVDTLESILRRGRPYPSRDASLNLWPVLARGCTYRSVYWFAGPASYDPDQRYPLLLVGHGGGQSTKGEMERCVEVARQYIEPWRSHIEDTGLFIAAPVCDQNWGFVGTALVQGVVSDILHHFPIDPDRIYLWGQSMGGNLAWRTAMHFPDRLAGAAPITCGYPYTREAFETLNNLPIYHIWAQDDYFGPSGRHIEPYLAQLDIPHISKCRNGGHQLYEDEFAAILNFFLCRRRSLYPRRVLARTIAQPAGAFTDTPRLSFSAQELSQADTRIDWQQDFAINRFYWLEITQLTTMGRPGCLWAQYNENRIEAEAQGISSFRLYLHGEMVDFSRPVSVEINGRQVFHGAIKPSATTLLNEVRCYADPNRIYTAHLDIDLKEVGTLV